MHVSLPISPASRASQSPHGPPPEPLLKPAGPVVVIGGGESSDPLGALVQPIVPSPSSLFGPRGAALVSPEGPLIIADTGHHRLLIWHQPPVADGQPADIVIGQPDFASEGRNAKGPSGPWTVNVPTGVATENGIVAVADAWNHRVLVWMSPPGRDNQPADIVLGQSDFYGDTANRGGTVRGDTLNWCYGVALIGGSLFVADTGNRRVLVWDQVPQRNGAPADRVLGQSDFTCRDENAGRDAGPLGMRWPHGIARIGSALFVSDAGNNRIMVWRDLPEQAGRPCDFVIGQADLASLEHNRGHYWPDASSLNMPYAIAAAGDRLIAADTANSRLLGWQGDGLGSDAPATALTGQPDFASKGDNRWRMPARDSLCWPYGLSLCGNMAIVADSGNNRVLLWELAS